MSNLINLRHLVEDKGKTFLTGITDVGKMTSLQKLDIFRVQKHIGFHIVQLKNLRHLRGSLEIQNLENVDNTEPVSEARLCEKTKLNQLWLSWNHDSCTVPAAALDVLEGLEPHPNLVSLYIRGYTGITSPTWLADKLLLTSLESLYLKDFSGLDLLPPLGQLPHLRKLHFTQMGAITIIGLGFYGDGQVKGFPRLEEMLISNMPEWIEWIGVEQIYFFPVLRSLKIQHCPKLNRLQVLCCNEKQWFPRLTMLEIEDCPEVVSYPCLKHSPSVQIQEHASAFMKLDHQRSCTLTAWCPSELYCTHLVSLDLKDCSEVEVLPPLGSLPQLRELRMIRLGALRQLGSEFYGRGQITGFPCLKKLSMEYLKEWREWNEGGHFDVFPHLEELSIADCPELNSLSCILALRENLRWFPSLDSLKIHCCPKFINFDLLLIPQLPQDVVVEISGETYEISVGDNGLMIDERAFTKSISRTTDIEHWINSKLASAEQVKVSGDNVTDELLSEILAGHICPSMLSISRCGRISIIHLSHLESLESLEIYGCDSVTHLSGLQAFIALKGLTVHGVPGFVEAWKKRVEAEGMHMEQINACLQVLKIDDFKILNLPVCKLFTNLQKLVIADKRVARISEEQGQALLLLVSLQELGFVRCYRLNALPSVLHRMPTLEHLELTFCVEIDSLPDNGLPASLQKLTIKRCDSLYDKCLEHGSERHKIAHISEIILESTHLWCDFEVLPDSSCKFYLSWTKKKTLM